MGDIREADLTRKQAPEGERLPHTRTERMEACLHEWAEWADRNGMTVSAAQTRKVLK
jgi:hypothetical protein